MVLVDCGMSLGRMIDFGVRGHVDANARDHGGRDGARAPRRRQERRDEDRSVRCQERGASLAARFAVGVSVGVCDTWHFASGCLSSGGDCGSGVARSCGTHGLHTRPLSPARCCSRRLRS
jgi:hypothetical protein